MPIYVCVKHVPDTAAVITLEGKTAYAEANIKFIVNPFDEFAIEEALQWGEKKGEEVVAVTVGKKDATSSLQNAMALGAVRGIHIVTDKQFVSPADTAKALAAGIKADGAPLAVFTGKQSVDSEGMQLPYFLAHALGMPVVNEVNELTLEGDKVLATREVGSGARETFSFSCPCVIGATKGLNTPRYPKLPDIMKAKKKPINTIPLETLVPGETPAPVLESLTLVAERAGGGAKILSGSLEEQVAELRRIIKEKARV